MSLPGKYIIAAATVLIVFGTTSSVSAQSMNGSWKVDTGAIHGKEVPFHVLASMQLDVNNNQFTADSGNLTSTGTVLANPQASPAQLTFSIGEGDDNGRDLKAIYEFRGANLVITFSEDGNFPSEFDSTEDNKYLALTYSAGTRMAGGAPPGGGPPRGGPPRGGRDARGGGMQRGGMRGDNRGQQPTESSGGDFIE